MVIHEYKFLLYLITEPAHMPCSHMMTILSERGVSHY